MRNWNLRNLMIEFQIANVFFFCCWSSRFRFLVDVCFCFRFLSKNCWCFFFVFFLVLFCFVQFSLYKILNGRFYCDHKSIPININNNNTNVVYKRKHLYLFWKWKMKRWTIKIQQPKRKKKNGAQMPTRRNNHTEV